MRTPKGYFKDKSAEQILSFCLLISTTILMLFCAIVRLCGGLWFSADLSVVPIPSEQWQDVIMSALLAFELVFTYKILCRCHWLVALAFAICHTGIAAFIPSLLWTNIFHIAMIMLIPAIYTVDLRTFIDSLLLWLLCGLYSAIFLTARIGTIKDASTNFVYNVLGAIDYKLFIVSLYLFIKYYGGIRLWKKQKRLIFQKDLTKKA